jgi:Mn2+/Fe2+ NRAMP family transporter
MSAGARKSLFQKAQTAEDLKAASIPAAAGTADRHPRHHLRWLWIAGVVGPGVMVMLADTDVGSIVTAAKSGATWGYRLLPLQIVLIPVLYVVMELTARLGIATGKGHAQLIAERFGRRWAMLSVSALLISTTGALVTEFAGIAGVAAIVGLPTFIVVPAAAAFLALVVVSGTYRRVELIGIGLGLFELAFILAAALARPDAGALVGSVASGQPLGNTAYLSLVAANVGAVVMPWMIFYQQAAIVDKGLGHRDLRGARVDTALGAVATQVVMMAVLVAAGATLFNHHAGPLNSVGQISKALTPSLGEVGGRLAFVLGTTGAALVAGIVVSLAASWAFAEMAGTPRSLNQRVRQAPLFYGIYFGSLAAAAALVLVSPSLVGLAVAVEIVNSLLLPIVLCFLVALAWTALPAPYRLRPLERAVLLLVTAAVIAMGIGLGVTALGL